jgi:hypothetical protein
VYFQCVAAASPATPPYEAPCNFAVYSEARIEGDQALDMKVWLSSATPGLGSTGAAVAQSAVTVRVDSFDGTYVRGVFSGTFDQPRPPVVTQAPIKGQVRFFFPVKEVK